MNTDRTPLSHPMRTAITSEYDVGTLWKSMAFPRGDRTSLHLHCLDQDTAPAPQPHSPALPPDPLPDSQQPGDPANVVRLDLCDHLRLDLSSLCAFTDGILVSWGGRGGEGSRSSNTLMYDALHPLIREGDLIHPSFHTGRSVSVAVPLAPKAGPSEEDVPAQHELVPSPPLRTSRVHKYLIDTSVSEDKPVVCMAVNGGHHVLKMMLYAMDHDIPVIALKGSGGITDGICILHQVRPADTIKKRAIRSAVLDRVEREFGKKDSDMLIRLERYFLDRLVIYEPQKPDTKHLDAIVVDALLKWRNFRQAEQYLQTLQRQVEEEEAAVRDRSESFVEKKISRVTMLLESLINHTPSACAVIVRNLHISYDTIHFDQLFDLYAKSPSRERTRCKRKVQIIGNYVINQILHFGGGDDNKPKPGGSVGDMGVQRYRQVREEVQKYTNHLMATPLRCQCHKKCDSCNTALNATDKSTAGTCLPPVQELFIWSLFFGNQDLSEALLEHVVGKIAACLFAFAVFTGMASEQRDNAQEHVHRQRASRFEELATRCLRHCFDTDVDKTEQLLIKQFQNWDGFSPLQIAIVTKSMAFVAEDGTKARLDRIWNGTRIGESGFVGTSGSGLSCRDDVARIFTPAFAFGLGLVFQLLFLLLFSYVLLFDLHSSVTPWFILLTIYVIDFAADEIRQLLMDNPVLRSGCTCNPRQKLRSFASQDWNILDIFSILLFALGMLVFVDDPMAFAFGRVFLCLDALCFFMRFLQMLLYFENLGVFLVMAKKSMKDTGYFMLILLTVMWGYLVASHGVLFPPPNAITSTWSYVLDLIFKGYWQAFNLDLQEISVCQEVTKGELEDGACKTESFLATHYGHYVASVLLALYLMFINVLLMNLLIAKFNNTFIEVYRQAKLHQSWQYCHLVLEYYTHTPAPFSMLSLLLTFILFVFGGGCLVVGLCCWAFCCEDDNDAAGSIHEWRRVGDDLEFFETQQMQEALKGTDAESGARNIQRQLDQQRVNLANIQGQLDQLRNDMQQVLRSLNSKSPPAPGHPP